MKKLALISLLFITSLAHAQRTRVTAQVLDPTGQLYQNCSYSVVWVNQSGQVGVLPSFNGGSLVQTVYPGQKCDGFAKFSIQLPPNTLITPVPNVWQFQICDQTGKYCFTSNETISTTPNPTDISTDLQNAAVPLPQQGGGGGGSPFAVVTNPALAATNTIVPAVNNIPGLSQKCPSGAASSQIAYQITDGSNNNVFSVTCGGQVTVTTGLGGTISTGDVFGALQTVPFSSSETFNAAGTMAFKTTLTGNVTSSSLINIPSSSYGKEIAFIICQDGTGSHTFAWPANVIGAPTVPTTASQCNGYIGVTDGVNAYIQTGSSTGGASGITSAAQTTNQIAKFTSSSANGTAGDSTASESGTPPNWTIPRQSQIRHSESFIWSQTPGGSISPGSNTVTLTPVPYGIDSTFVSATNDTWVYLSGGTGTAEAVKLASTTCTTAAAGSGSCTMTFTAANSHTGAWTIGTATGGWQEAINDCEQTSSTPRQCTVVLPCGTPSGATATNLYGTVEYHGNNIYTRGNGCALINQNFLGPGVLLGDRTRTAQYFFNGIDGVTFVPNATTDAKVNLIQSMSRTGCPSSCVATIQFTAPHDFTAQDAVNGTWVIVGGNLNDNTFAGEYQIASVPDTTHITLTTFNGNNPTTVYAGGYLIREHAAIVDNLSIHGIINNIRFSSGSSTGFWAYHIIGLIDQDMHITDIDNQGSGHNLLAPTDEWQGAMLLAPGPNNPNGAVAYVYAMDCSLQGSGNCIDWQSGDDIFVTDSIIQGYTRFGIRVSRRRGGFGVGSFKGLHFESGGVGTLAKIGTASFISNGVTITTNTGIGNVVPNYGISGNGLLQWLYYVQPVSSTSDTMCSTQPSDSTTGVANNQRCAINYGNGPVMFAGEAFVDSVSGGTPNVAWAAVPLATSYNLYRVNAATATNPQIKPFGTGTYLVASGINPLTACTDNVCNVTDSVGLTPTSTTISTYTTSSFAPYLPYWPGAVVMSGLQDTGGTVPGPPSVGSYTGPFGSGFIISTEVNGQDSIALNGPIQIADGPGTNSLSPFKFKSYGQQQGGNSSASPGFPTLYPAKTGLPGVSDSSNTTNTKGLWNFTPFLAGIAYPYSIFTFFDSNLPKTLASMTRPTADAADCENGMAAAGIYYNRCQNGFNWYVNSLATGTPVFQINSSGVLGAVNNASGVVYHVDGQKYSSLCSLVTSTIPINTAATIYEDILETNISCDPFNQSRIIRLFLAPQVSPYTWNVPLRIGSNEILAGSVQAFGSGTATHGTEVRPGTSYANPYVSTLPSGFTIAATTTGCGGVFPAAGTYLIEVSWGPDTTRETLPALETSVTVDGATQCFKVTHPASPPANVTNYDIYGCATAGCTSGQEFWQGQSAIGSDFTYSSFQSGSGKPVTINNTGAFIVVGNQNGPAANATAANNFDAKVQDLSINCIGDSTISGGYNGTVAAAILTGEEGSGLFRVDAKNCPGAASYIWEAYSTGLGGSNSRMVDITGNLGSSGDAHTNPTVAELYVDNMTTSRGVDGFTFQPSASTTPVCIEVNTNFGGTAGGFGILNGHMEHCTDGALFTQQGQGTVINATCSPSSVTNCVHVSSTGGNVAVMGVRGGATATILDDSQSPSFSTTAGYVPLWSNFTMSKSVQTFGSVPTCTATGIGTGGSPGCALATGSNSQNGTMNITTGSAATAANGTISLIFPGTGFGVHGNSCTYRLLNVTAGGTWDPRATLIGSVAGTGHDDSLWDNNASNLTVSKQYSINYTCGSN